MRWFEERVKFVKENIKMLPDDFMKDWSWDKPLTRIEFLVLMTPIKSDKELLIGLFDCDGYEPYQDLQLIYPDKWSDGTVVGGCDGSTILPDSKYLGDNTHNFKYYYANSAFIFGMKGDDFHEEKAFIYYKNIIKNEYPNFKYTIPKTIKTYTKLRDYADSFNKAGDPYFLEFLVEIYRNHASSKTFRPDEYINIAEASKATLYSYYKTSYKDDKIDHDIKGIGFKYMNLKDKLVYFRNNLETNNHWYQPYIAIQKDIQGLDKNTSLTPSDIPNTKQLAQMMFQTLMNAEWKNRNYYNRCFANWEGICE